MTANERAAVASGWDLQEYRETLDWLRSKRGDGTWRDALGRALQGHGCLVTDTPNPYRAATDRAPRRSQPSDTPGYSPYGAPPDPYALAARRTR